MTSEAVVERSLLVRCSQTNGTEEVLLPCIVGGEGLGLIVGVECPFPLGE